MLLEFIYMCVTMILGFKLNSNYNQTLFANATCELISWWVSGASADRSSQSDSLILYASYFNIGVP